MQIVNWNCRQGGFGHGKDNKYKKIMALDADIYVIQECEPVERWSEECKKAIPNYIWKKGPFENGVLVFARPGISLQNLEWINMLKSVFVPVLVNNQFTLIAVWTVSPGLIEDFYNWQKFHKDKLNKNTVIVGDFNSNACWDKEHKNYSHLDVVRSLNERGLESVYHIVHDETQGEETIPTRYQWKGKGESRQFTGKYHIDHCFMNKDNIVSYEILPADKWMDYSDHMPIVINIDPTKNVMEK